MNFISLMFRLKNISQYEIFIIFIIGNGYGFLSSMATDS